MSLQNLSREQLFERFYQLEDVVAEQLNKDSSVDDFLDNTIIFDEWEEVLPDSEYSIFMITVLNNIRTKSIVNAIISSIVHPDLENERTQSFEPENTEGTKDLGHPFS